MAEKHYQCKNAEKPIEVGKFKFTFGLTHWNDGTRTYWGIYSTDKKDEIAALDTAVEQGKVYPLTDQEALVYLEKKTTLGSHKSVRESGLQQKLLRENKPSAEHVADEEEDFEAIEAVDMSTIVAKEEAEQETVEEELKSEEQTEKPKRKRGRPRKKPLTDGD